MPRKEFTKQELLDLLNKLTVDGKVSFNSLGGIIFDSKFPEAIFGNAMQEMIQARDDERRYFVLANSLALKCKTAYEIQKQICELSFDKMSNKQAIQVLKTQLSNLESEISSVEIEFGEVKSRRDKRLAE